MNSTVYLQPQCQVHAGVTFDRYFLTATAGKHTVSLYRAGNGTSAAALAGHALPHPARPRRRVGHLAVV